MNILIIGNGGREHAMAWHIAQADKIEKIFVAPGNAGTRLEHKVENLDIASTDIPALIHFAKNNDIALTIVGPEAPLAAGVVDQFQQENLPCFGPTQKMAQLESSKTFAKDFLKRHHILSAQYETFTDADKAIAYLQSQTFPIVIKADGLAAGKGVVIAENKEIAIQTVNEMLNDKRFGDASNKIIIESFLQGEECSFIVMCDGKNVLPFATSQDHKARDDGDKGPNTGGMGAYSPAPLVTEKLFNTIMESVIYPTVNGMASEGNPYVGFLYAGLMINKKGEPYVLEFNCRLGDPETQPILMRLQSDLVELCFAALNGKLDQTQAHWDKRSALGVVLASRDYPEQPKTGEVITGLDHTLPNAKVFHAGTTYKDSHVLTNGGRVLCVTALGDPLIQAKQQAYEQAKLIHWPSCFYRNDIGDKAL
ncbi:MAG: phosphoribosylamine--glycine ligase [Legionellales bacterium]|jgi:phosphoribosylamine--glycine ligase